MDEKEIVYIPYGLDEINQLEFLNAAANDVQSYVNSKAWSKKRKEAFLNAYLDIMSKGVTGASNESGIWKINHKGDPIDLDSKSKRDKEMYQAAAYYILQKMMGITPKSRSEEKKELIPFDNNTLFKTYLMNNYYGGSKDLDMITLWDYLDPRDSTGKRGTSKRKERMREILEGYKKSIEDGKYSFENTPFKDITDFRNRIDNAIGALNTDDENDDIDAFNKLGLNSRQWFSNGLGDPSGQTLNGQELTYNQLNQLNSELAKRKAEEESALLKAKNEAAKNAAYKNKLFFRTLKSNFPTTTAEQLKEKYGGDLNQLIAALNLYSQSNIQDLSSDLKRELFGAMKLAQNNVSDNIYKKLITTPTYKGSARNRFKSINGVDNYIYDTKTGNVIQVLNRELFENGNAPTSDLFSGIKTTKELLLEYLNSKIPGMTNAEWQELMAIGADVASIIDPEPLSAAGLGAGAAELRRQAKNNTPGFNWGFWDYVGQGIDYLTGAVGAIPLAGDLVLGGKTIINGSKMIPKLTKALRLLGRSGAWKDIYDSFDNGGKQTATKILNGEELTVQDWRNIGQLVRGIAGHHSLNVGNRAVKKVAEKSGFETEASSSTVNKLGWTGRKGRELGFFGSKIKGNESIPTSKLKKIGEDGKVEEKPITFEQREKLGRTKPSEIDAKAKELGIEIPEGYKIDVSTSWRTKAKNFIPYRDKNKEAFGTTTKETNRNNDEFNSWLKDRGTLSKIVYGWNPRLEQIRKGLNISSVSPKVQEKSETLKTKPVLALPNKNLPLPNSPLENNKNVVSPLNIRREIEIPARKYTGNLNDRLQIEAFLLSYGLGGLKSTSMKEGFGGNAVKAGKYEHELLNIALSRSKAKEIRNNPGKLSIFRGENARKVLNLIDSKKATDKEVVEIIKGLKKKGYLKQGGVLEQDSIYNVLKNIEL